MAEPREALEIRVDHETCDRDRPQPADDRVELEAREEVQRERQRAERRHLHARERPRGSSRPAVRGLRASISASMSRFSPIASEPRADHRERDPEQVVCRRHVVDGQERADVRERQREDRVLDLDERGEAPRVATSALRSRLHVLRGIAGDQLECVRRAPARSRSKPSRQPPGEPGRFTTSVAATDAGDARARAARAASSRSHRRAAPPRCPGTSRSSTDSVASGVTSRGARPVPPVVSTRLRRAASSRSAAAICVALVGHDPTLDLVALRLQQLDRAASRSRPRARRAATPSETVSTAAVTPAPSSSRRGATSVIDHAPCRSPSPCRRP